ncbi:MAG: DEAD/DEAH box helicase family protein [Methylococcaceae bacterium]|nr:DEAD/DEAH box helicase family protein [Methylococcaceae bacterium]
MSNFSFLQEEWLAIHDSASKAESYLNTDCRAACWYARMTLEQMVNWVYKVDPNFRCYEESLGARVHDPSFRHNAGESIFTKATLVITIGNRAAHGKVNRRADALTAITELFHIAYWLARTYGTRQRPNPALQFNPALIPPAPQAKAVSVEELAKQEGRFLQQQAENAALKAQLEGMAAVHEELAALRAEIAQAKTANQAEQDAHDYNEEQTRDYFIDLLLQEAGWALKNKDDREFEVAGMPNNQGVGFIDYVLWGDDGKPLAVVEAKRTRRDARAGQQQAKLYADCLEASYQRRPVIFYTNGYEHWFWDDSQSAPRRVEGFHKKDELELLMQRRSSRLSLASAAINPGIAGRSYQQQAIRSVTEAIEQHNQRRSLVVMATGAGKTRTVIALVNLLVQCNWAKRVLFLADRVSLVRQATKAFVKFAPELGAVNLLENSTSQGRVSICTYPTMLNLINDNSSDIKRFGIGYFDVVIVDEAHRSIYAKYGALFSYFDSYLIGLTATPKDEVDRNTYGLFELQKGVPTFAYGLEEAIADGYLVKPNAVSVPLKFIREGIKYKDLSEDERQQWDELDWGDDEPPEQIDSAALNQWLFNEATVDKVLEHLMTKGEKVASGDRLGKTIIFAKNNRHAEFIADRFNANYPEFKGLFARVITFKTEYAQSLIDDFSIKDKLPHIAISVDMLDTGIDVPEVVNLVFFKLVRSKTKFWQMIGRGTRLCPDLYAPGQDKQFFNVFDYCQNIEYFNGDLEVKDPPIPESLDSRLFQARVGLLLSLDGESSESKVKEPNAPYEVGLRDDTARLLHDIVANMSLANFIVRPKRLYVEKFSQREAWNSLSQDEALEMANQLSALPSQLRDSEEEAKRFDLMILRAQLCILQSNPGFDRIKNAIKDIAEALELQESIPAIRNQMPLIQSLLSDEWWQDVTVGMLEHVRRQLRLLVKLIEKTKRPIIFTDFEDEIGEGNAIDLPLKPVGLDYERFKNKTRDFLREHEDRIAIQKLRRNLPITQSDLDELEKILLEQAANNNDLVDKAREESGGLGLFVRSLVGLERNAAVEAMSEFLNDSTATASQLTFIKLIVECLTSNGMISDDLFYQSPFTDYAPTGPEGMFSPAKITQLNMLIQDIRQRAVA